jgi:hypothetical protein
VDCTCGTGDGPEGEQLEEQIRRAERFLDVARRRLTGGAAE